jgi:DNA-binding response OmpR family regulator/predicted ATPase
MRWLAPLVVLGCTQKSVQVIVNPEGAPALQAAEVGDIDGGLRGTPVLATTRHVPDGPVTYTVAGALSEGELVHIGRSTRGEGAGPCLGTLGALCLDYVEIYNGSGVDVNLDGVRLVASSIFDVTGTTYVAPDAYVLFGVRGARERGPRQPPRRPELRLSTAGGKTPRPEVGVVPFGHARHVPARTETRLAVQWRRPTCARELVGTAGGRVTQLPPKDRVSMQLSDRRVDLDRRQVLTPVGQPTQELTPREADLLRYLADRPGQTVTREKLLAEVWGYADQVVSRAADTTIGRLRAKIECDPKHPVHVLTVHGGGYRFLPQGPAPEQPVPAEPSEPPIRLGEVVVDLAQATVHKHGERSTLTSLEAAVLRCLLQADGAVVSRATLLQTVWHDAPATSRVVDMTVRRLRTKIEVNPSTPAHLLSVRGRGYQLRTPPRLASDFFGRAEERRLLAALVTRERCTLLLGAGGIGKTRLAAALHAEGGAGWWVHCGSAPTRAALVHAVASKLGVDVRAADLVAAVAAALGQGGQGLLVLDDLDRVAHDVAPVLQCWLDEAPGCRILATSRRRLPLPGLAVLELGPLGPSEAAQLFVHHAKRASLAFDAAGCPKGTLAKICARLDHLPLALELAAARTSVLTPAQILARLDLDLLSRPGGSDPKHATMRGAIAHSWQMLTPQDQRTLQRLSLFCGGFSLEDVEGVLGTDAVDVLQRLRDQSLVMTERSAPLKLGLYATVQAFAAERRREADAANQLARDHVAWFARLGRPPTGDPTHDDALASAQAAAWTELEGAYALAVQIEATELAGRIAIAIAQHAHRRGPFARGIQVATKALALPLTAGTRGSLLTWRAAIHRFADQPQQALRDAAEAIETVDIDAHPLVHARAHDVTAGSLAELGRHAEASSHWVSLAKAYTALGQPARAAHAMARSEWRSADPELANQHMKRAIRLAQKAGNRWLAGMVSELLGRRATSLGQFGLAERHLETALGIYREKTRPRAAARLLLGLSLAHLNRGRLDDVLSTAQEASSLCAELGAHADRATAAGYCGLAVLYQGDVQASERWFRRGREHLATGGVSPLAQGEFGMYEAELMLAVMDPHSALGLVQAARHVFTERWDRALVDTLLGVVTSQLGDPGAGLAQALAGAAVLDEIAHWHDAALGHFRAGLCAALGDDPALAREQLRLGMAAARSPVPPQAPAGHARGLLLAALDG